MRLYRKRPRYDTVYDISPDVSVPYILLQYFIELKCKMTKIRLSQDGGLNVSCVQMICFYLFANDAKIGSGRAVSVSFNYGLWLHTVQGVGWDVPLLEVNKLVETCPKNADNVFHNISCLFSCSLYVYPHIWFIHFDVILVRKSRWTFEKKCRSAGISYKKIIR